MNKGELFLSPHSSSENSYSYNLNSGVPFSQSLFRKNSYWSLILATLLSSLSIIGLYLQWSESHPSVQIVLTLIFHGANFFLFYQLLRFLTIGLLGPVAFHRSHNKFIFQFVLCFAAFMLADFALKILVISPVFNLTPPVPFFLYFSPPFIYSLVGAAILSRMNGHKSDTEKVKKTDATFSRFFDDEKTEKATLLTTALILGPGMIFLLHQNPFWPATLQTQLTIVVYLSSLFLFFNFFEILLTQVAKLALGQKPAPNFVLEYIKFFLTFVTTSFMMYAMIYIPIFHYNPQLSLGMFITPPSIYSFIAAAIFHRFKQMKDIALKSKVAQAEAQYSLLESQMQPHFLFNSLNVLSELIYVDPDLANSMAQKMADLYREILNNSKNNFSTLESEISILQKYIEIQKIRFGDRIDFSADVSPAFYNLQIPSLMLQTLVENAIKHGISPKKEGGKINLSVHKKNNMFEVCISNTGALYKGHQNSKKSTGLQNTQNRLDLAYGKKNAFQIFSDNRKTYVKFFITGRTP